MVYYTPSLFKCICLVVFCLHRRKPVLGGGLQTKKRRLACASTQFDQNLCYSLIAKLLESISINLLQAKFHYSSKAVAEQASLGMT